MFKVYYIVGAYRRVTDERYVTLDMEDGCERPRRKRRKRRQPVYQHQKVKVQVVEAVCSCARDMNLKIDMADGV